MRRWVAISLVALVLVAANLLTTRWARDQSLVVAVVSTVLLLVIGRRAGLTWHDLGLGRGTFGRGLRWAGVAVGIVGIVFLVLVVIPAGRDLLQDDRAPNTLGEALVEAFVVIPLRTVVFEEVAFRGVLWGLLRREWSTKVATIGSSIAFGLWHILPATGFASANETSSDLIGRSTLATIAVVIGTVLFTTVAGIVFCELRRRSDSLLAPMGLHWATNGLGTLASSAVR